MDLGLKTKRESKGPSSSPKKKRKKSKYLKKCQQNDFDPEKCDEDLFQALDNKDRALIEAVGTFMKQFDENMDTLKVKAEELLEASKRACLLCDHYTDPYVVEHKLASYTMKHFLGGENRDAINRTKAWAEWVKEAAHKINEAASAMKNMDGHMKYFDNTGRYIL